MRVRIEGTKTTLGCRRRGWQPNFEEVMGDLYGGTIFVIPACVGVTTRSWHLFAIALGITAGSAPHATYRLIRLTGLGVTLVLRRQKIF
jgi:hypothetical protein